MYPCVSAYTTLLTCEFLYLFTVSQATRISISGLILCLLQRFWPCAQRIKTQHTRHEFIITIMSADLVHGCEDVKTDGKQNFRLLR